MNERYRVLFRLPNELYLEGSPVLVAAGALLMDQLSGGVVAQLKLRNIGKKHIRTVKVRIVPMDSLDRPLASIAEYDYLDLDASQDEEFGWKNPIRLSAPTARAFSVSVAEVGFTDKTVWSPSDTAAAWTPLPEPERLETALQDPELIKQYRLEFGSRARYLPAYDRDLYRCWCGTINAREEAACHRCGQKTECDPAALKARCAERLEKEKQAAQKTRKKTIISVSAAAVVALILIAIFVVFPYMRYEKAVSLVEAGEYEPAINLLEKLGEYSNSKEWLELANKEQTRLLAYQAAVELLDKGSFAEAVEAFEALNDYRDSAQLKIEASNRYFESLFESVDFLNEEYGGNYASGITLSFEENPDKTSAEDPVIAVVTIGKLRREGILSKDQSGQWLFRSKLYASNSSSVKEILIRAGEIMYSGSILKKL